MWPQILSHQQKVDLPDSFKRIVLINSYKRKLMNLKSFRSNNVHRSGYSWPVKQGVAKRLAAFVYTLAADRPSCCTPNTGSSPVPLT